MQTQADSTNQGATIVVACPTCLKMNRILLARAQTSKPACGACKAEIDVHGPIVEMNTRQVQKTIEASPLPVIIDFWAPWCAPCRAFAPTFERVASERAGQAVFVKLNTEVNMFASEAFGIRGIPTLAGFKNGREVERISGALPYEHFLAWSRQITG